MDAPAQSAYWRTTTHDTSSPRSYEPANPSTTHHDSSPHGVVRGAWGRTGHTLRIGALIVAATALTASLSDAVPFASGLAISILVIAAVVDTDQRRLPNSIVLTAALSMVVVAGVEVAGGASVRVAHVVIGLTVMVAPLLLLHIISPASMGFGDVKVAAVLGAAVGAVDWQLAIVALAIAAGSTATVGVIGRRSTIAFGPGLVLGATLALAFHTVLLPVASPSDRASVASGSHRHRASTAQLTDSVDLLGAHDDDDDYDVEEPRR